MHPQLLTHERRLQYSLFAIEPLKQFINHALNVFYLQVHGLLQCGQVCVGASGIFERLLAEVCAQCFVEVELLAVDNRVEHIARKVT